MVGLHVRVTASTITMIVGCWWILSGNRNMGVGVYSVATNLHVILLMVGQTAVILDNVGVSA